MSKITERDLDSILQQVMDVAKTYADSWITNDPFVTQGDWVLSMVEKIAKKSNMPHTSVEAFRDGLIQAAAVAVIGAAQMKNIAQNQ